MEFNPQIGQIIYFELSPPEKFRVTFESGASLRKSIWSTSPEIDLEQVLGCLGAWVPGCLGAWVLGCLDQLSMSWTVQVIGLL